MQVRIDPDVAKKLRAEAKKNDRSASREATLALALYYAAKKRK